MNVALIIAGGSGVRMHQDVPKQFLKINNKPVILYTMEAFERNPQTDAILVVTLDAWKDFVWASARQYGITKLRWVITGGVTGQESIENGVRELAKTCEPDTAVMVHDAIRPLISDDIIEDSLAVFEKYGSAVAAIPCAEAVFQSADGSMSRVSIPREQLFRTQTPQTYTLEKLLWAHDEAKKQGIKNTVASCTLMQELGETVYFSKGSEKNIKLTTLEDVDIFRALLTDKAGI